MNLWKLSDGDLLQFERLRLRFENMMKLLKQVKFGILEALKYNSKNGLILGNLYSSMQQSYALAEKTIEKEKK